MKQAVPGKHVKTYNATLPRVALRRLLGRQM